jgi:hypothetical protein
MRGLRGSQQDSGPDVFGDVSEGSVNKSSLGYLVLFAGLIFGFAAFSHELSC